MTETEYSEPIVISAEPEAEKKRRISRQCFEHKESSMDFFKALEHVLYKIMELEKYFRDDLEEMDYETFREEFG